MKLASAAMLAGAALALSTACSSQSMTDASEVEETANSAPSSTSQAAPAPAAPTRIGDPNNIGPAVLHKNLRERGMTGCTEDPNGPCDVEFAVNSIQQGVQCEDPYPALGANEQLVRFEFEIWTAPSFMYPDSATVFFIDRWGIGDAEGVDNDLTIQTAILCGGELTGDQIQKSLLPGTHVEKAVIFTAPKDATTLRLYSGDAGDGWTWDIPPA